jgi:hypothetical protein
MTGSSGENIINTHTDGRNATEENGGLGLLALVKYFAGLPSRNRDLHFVLATGDFQLPQFTSTIPNARPEVGGDATIVWMPEHPEIYMHAVACVTAEHLGRIMWTNDSVNGQYVPTGDYESGAIYTAQRQGSLDVCDSMHDA